MKNYISTHCVKNYRQSFFAVAFIALFALVTSSAKAAVGAYLVELPPGTVLANNATIDFSSVTVGTSNSITLTVSNASLGSATANIALTGGNAGDFSLNKTSVNVASGNSKTVIVTFAPSATGPRTTTLAFTGNSTYNFTLSGSGQPDTTPPVITINSPNPATVECHSAYNDTGATASDAVVGTVAVTTSGNVDTNTPGNYTMTYSATDGTNPTSATRLVQVVDTTPPTINLTGSNQKTLECHHNYNEQGATASDTCAGTLAVTITGSVDANTVGDYTLTYTATDTFNSTSKIRTVHVTDTTPPVLSIQGQNPKTIECHNNYNEPGVTASDACAGTLTVTTTGTVDANTVGSYTLTYSATDVIGNTATATRVVLIVDTTPPVVNVTGPNQKTVECHHNYNEQGATASDACSGTLTVATTGSVDANTVGDYTLTYTATDVAGNSATNFRAVHVTDTTPPVLSIQGQNPKTVECHHNFNDPGASANDTCAGTLAVTTTGTVDPSTVGSYTLTYSATDPANNTISDTRVVLVVDTTPPVVNVTGPNEKTVECHHNFNDQGATASDACAGTLTVTTTGSVDANTVGDYTLTYAATDVVGNSATNFRVVHVTDTTPPVLSIQGQNPKTVECHHHYNDPGAAASDDCAGSLKVTTTGTVDANTVGIYTLTYSATDPANNTISDTRVVQVVDTTPPVVTVNGQNPKTVECHHNFNDPGATASDTCAGGLIVTVTGTVDANTPGDYTLTYTADDGAPILFQIVTPNDIVGNSASVIRVVHVQDTTPPVITVNGSNPYHLDLHTTFSDPGASASDACTGPAEVTTTGSVDQDTPGAYTLTYSATDGHNSSSATRVVNVSTLTINLTCPGDQLVTSTSTNGAVVSFTPTATGGCTTPLVVAVPASGSTFPLGDTLVTVTATDTCGTTQTCTFYVTVIRPVPPPVEFQDANNTMPPSDAGYLGLPQRPVSFGANVVVRDLRLRNISQSLAIPALGTPRTDTYTALTDFGLSLDGGNTFNVVSNTATVTVLSTRQPDVSGKSYVNTEMLSLSLTIGTGPSAFLLRESPTKASLGQETVRGTTGNYWLSGYYDILGEVSVDNGQNWLSTHVPIHAELRIVPRNPRQPPARN